MYFGGDQYETHPSSDLDTESLKRKLKAKKEELNLLKGALLLDEVERVKVGLYFAKDVDPKVFTKEVKKMVQRLFQGSVNFQAKFTEVPVPSEENYEMIVTVAPPNSTDEKATRKLSKDFPFLRVVYQTGKKAPETKADYILPLGNLNASVTGGFLTAFEAAVGRTVSTVDLMEHFIPQRDIFFPQFPKTLTNTLLLAQEGVQGMLGAVNDSSIGDSESEATASTTKVHGTPKQEEGNRGISEWFKKMNTNVF